MIVLCVIHGIASVLESFLICHPSAAAWNPKIEGSCQGQIVSYIILEVVGLALDVAILVLPLRRIATLHLPFEGKRNLMLVFSVGAVCVYRQLHDGK